MRSLFIAIIAGLLLSSCSVQKGYLTTNASLQSGNFKIIGMAKGHSGTFYMFGIGGQSKEGLLYLAKTDMYTNAKLKDNQAIANLTVDDSWTYVFPLFIRHDVFVSGDIIQFKDSGVGAAVPMGK